MGLDRATLERLRTAANSFVTKSHGGYIAEALQCTNATRSPVIALRLLDAMWDSSYASRIDQKIALNEVGKWLEDRLYREPSVTAEAVALELGWLRRLARIAEASHVAADEGRTRGSHRPQEPSQTFGKRIARIEERRRETLAEATRTAIVLAPVDAAPPPPDRLPPTFEAEFVDFSDARKARKTARDRDKSGKPRKDRLLPIRPKDPQLVPLAAGLVCSVLETRGFDAPFEASLRKNGADCAFHVTAMEERDGKRLALAISLAPGGDESGTGASE